MPIIDTAHCACFRPAEIIKRTNVRAPRLHLAPQISAIGPDAWDACSGGNDPFTSYAFLSALEDSGCVQAETGWQPAHLHLRQGQEIVGVVAAYLKSHSYGEYVFDHGWADAFERAGGRYYPKLQASIPFSPVNGPRLLTQDAAHVPILAQGLRAACGQAGASGAHITFQTAEETTVLEGAGFLTRRGLQFHFENRGYADFESYLSTLTARKRKNIRKERAAAANTGLRIEALSGDGLKTGHFDAFYQFYQDTSDRKWGQAYLNRTFFDLIHQRMADRLVLILAFDGNRAVAGALNFRSSTTLYGRNWGSLTDHKFLHFELCYYQAIDHALAHGLQRVEAGAQGGHKISRGYEPRLTYSSHYIEHPGLRDAVAGFLAEEQRQMQAEANYIHEHMSPFKQKQSHG